MNFRDGDVRIVYAKVRGVLEIISIRVFIEKEGE